MSTHISGKPLKAKRVRYNAEVREDIEEEKGEREESVVFVNEGADGSRDQGSRTQEVTRYQVLQREIIIQRGVLIAAAVCLMLLCILALLRTIDMSMYYNSAYTILTLERNNLQSSYANLTLERNILQSSYANLTLERNYLQSSYANLTLWINQSNYSKLAEENVKLQREVNELTEGKSCPSGWKKFGCSCYYRSTETKTWDESRHQCQMMGADLVIINSKEEQEFIRGYGPLKEASWIGLSESDGKWGWVNGSPLTTGYWHSGWPADTKNHNCAKHCNNLDPGQWTNGQCANTHFWMCEK